MATYEIPERLQEFSYPDALFHDSQGVISFDEYVLRMAKYAIVESLRLPATEEKKIEIATGTVSQAVGFYPGIRRVWAMSHGNSDGLASCSEVEIEADYLGVLEIVFPFNPEEMAKAEAAEAAEPAYASSF